MNPNDLNANEGHELPSFGYTEGDSQISFWDPIDVEDNVLSAAGFFNLNEYSHEMLTKYKLTETFMYHNYQQATRASVYPFLPHEQSSLFNSLQEKCIEGEILEALYKSTTTKKQQIPMDNYFAQVDLRQKLKGVTIDVDELTRAGKGGSAFNPYEADKRAQETLDKEYSRLFTENGKDSGTKATIANNGSDPHKKGATSLLQSATQTTTTKQGHSPSGANNSNNGNKPLSSRVRSVGDNLVLNTFQELSYFDENCYKYTLRDNEKSSVFDNDAGIITARATKKASPDLREIDQQQQINDKTLPHEKDLAKQIGGKNTAATKKKNASIFESHVLPAFFKYQCSQQTIHHVTRQDELSAAVIKYNKQLRETNADTPQDQEYNPESWMNSVKGMFSRQIPSTKLVLPGTKPFTNHFNMWFHNMRIRLNYEKNIQIN